MKQFSLITFVFIFILASCAPATAIVPTQTAIPTSTLAPIPLPTITPTPAPENLADAIDLQTWIEQYFNAYGGNVTVNGTAMDANQLTNAIKANPDSFTQTKQINGSEYSFLVVNGAPLALMGTDGKWDEATLKNISNLTDVSFGIGGIVGSEWNAQFYFYKFTQKDSDLRIKQSSLTAPADIFIASGILHEGEGSYDWSIPDTLIKRYTDEGLQVRATNIIWAGDSQPDWLVELSKKGMQNPEAYKDEFTTNHA